MSKSTLVRIYTLLCCLFISNTIFADKIADIKVDGIKRTAQSVVISVSGLEVGQELKAEDTKNAVQQLYNSKLFEDIQIDGEKVNDGIVLTIRVKEWPIISKVSFKGNKKIKTKDLQKKCKLREFDIGSENAIFDAAVQIRKDYEDKGYYLVNINPVIDTTGEDKIRIQYVIEEGKQVKIKNINIEGNKRFSAKKLKSKLKHFFFFFYLWIFAYFLNIHF